MIEIVFLIVAVLLIIFGKENSVFVLSLLWSSFSLPFFVISQSEIGLLSTLVEAVGVLAIIKVFIKVQVSKTSLFFVFVLSILYLAIGLLMALGGQSVMIILLAAKLFLLPIIFGLYGFVQVNSQIRLFVVMFTLQIINLIAASVQSLLGPTRLQSIGLDYGTNVRTFDSILRAPGLTLTNYYLGSFSAVCFALAYTQLFTQKMQLSNKYTILIKTSMFSSLICLLLSSFRSGILFVLVFVLFTEMFVKRNLTKLSIVVALGSAIIIFAVSNSFFLVNSQSASERFLRWENLFHGEYLFYGQGLGSSGAASLSSYASLDSKVVTDNQYLSALYQCGVVGLILLILLLLYLFTATDKSGKAFLVSLSSIMFFIEAWDFTLMMSVCFIVVFNGIRLRNSNEKQNFLSD